MKQPILKAKKLEVINSKTDIPVIYIQTNVKWYRRIWYSITNPFTYIFGGYRRY
jgi:hypothetical protein